MLDSGNSEIALFVGAEFVSTKDGGGHEDDCKAKLSRTSWLRASSYKKSMESMDREALN